MERKPKTVQKWTEEFPDLSFDGLNLLCKVCNVELPCTLKSNAKRHTESKSHMTLKDATTNKQRRFNIDLFNFMVGCNIAWKQLDKPIFKEFIGNCIGGQYGEVKTPSSTTLRQNYSPQVADDIVSNISSELDGKCIWLSVNETTNGIGYKIANVFVGSLEEQCATKEYLLASKSLNCFNAENVSTLVNESLRLLWKNDHDVSSDKFLFFVTNGTEYMKQAGQLLQDKYNCLHVTSFAHNLHRVAEVVGEFYPRVDRLISSVQVVFKKAPEPVRLFRKLHPEVQLPPDPVLTRWGTWIEAATYYFYNLEKVKQVLQQLDAGDTAAIANALEAAMDTLVQDNLQEIFNSYSQIPQAIRQLEQRPKTDVFSITEEMNVMYDLRQQISYLQVESATKVLQKLNQVLENNPGFVTLSSIDRLLRKQEVDFSLPGLHEASLHKYPLFRYAPVTCIDTEAFYKWIFTDRRRSLTSVHMEEILLVNWYYYLSSEQEGK